MSVSPAEYPPAASPSLVADWGRCSRCDALCAGEEGPFGVLVHQCDTCARALEAEHAANSAELAQIVAKLATAPEAVVDVLPHTTLRPFMVLPWSEALEDAPNFGEWGEAAVWRIPDQATPTARRVAEAISLVVTEHLLAGWSLQYCLGTAALGRDIILRKLETIGNRMDRKTVASGISELVALGVLEQVGQMGDWVDIHADNKTSPVHKTGAYLYALKVTIREIGSRIADALTTKDVTLGGISPQHRARRCLRWASRNAKQGNRNGMGYWLACRCKESGTEYSQAQTMMLQYQGSVAQTGHLYTRTEATATVRSVYKARKVASQAPPVKFRHPDC